MANWIRIFWVICILLCASTALAEVPELRTPPGYLDRSGLSELVVFQTANGYIAGYLLGLSIVNVDDLGSEDGLRVAGGALLGLGVGLGATLLATHDREVNTGDVVTIDSAASWGLVNGLLWPMVANADSSRPYALSGLLGDLAGLGAGLWIASSVDLTPGEASLFQMSFTDGLLVGLFGAMAVLGADTDKDLRTSVAVGLGAGNAALVGSVLTGLGTPMGRRRIMWMQLGAAMGGLSGLGLGWVIAPDEPRAWFGTLALGLPVGGLVAYLVSEDSDVHNQRFDPNGAAVSMRNGEIELRAPSLQLASVPLDYLGTSHTTELSVGVLEGTW